MEHIGLIFLASLGIFCTLFSVVALERWREERVVAVGIRKTLDGLLDAVIRAVNEWTRYISRHVVQWSWYVLAHVVLRSVLFLVVKIYEWLEASFYRNRHRTQVLQTERQQRTDSMLGLVAKHKAETALTTAEKRRRRKRSLEGKS